MDEPSLDVPALAAVLAPRELERAARFRFELHRRRYIVAWAGLRSLLGTLLGQAPGKLPLAYEPAGKPVLPGGPAFSLAHSENCLLIGIAGNGRLGVDIELRRPVPDTMSLARGNFSDEELRALAVLPPEHRSAAFLRVWTRKEALLKAVGTGLLLRPALVSVGVEDVSGNVLRSSASDSIDVRHWGVRSVQLSTGQEAAVAWDRSEFSWRIGGGTQSTAAPG